MHRNILSRLESLSRRKNVDNIYDGNGLHIIFYAIMANNMEICSRLVRKMKNVCLRDRFGLSPLSWAIYLWYNDIVHLLLSTDISLLEMPDNDGGHALETCLKYDNLEGFDIIYEMYKSSPKLDILNCRNRVSGDTILHYMFKNDLTERIDSYLVRKLWDIPNKRLQKPFFYLIFYKDLLIKILRKIQFPEIQVNDQDIYGNTAVMYSIILSSDVDTDMLITHYAKHIDYFLQNKKGQTIFHLAYYHEYDISRVVKLSVNKKIKKHWYLFDDNLVSLHDILVSKEVIMDTGEITNNEDLIYKLYALLNKKFGRKVLNGCRDPTEYILGDLKMLVKVKYTNTCIYWIHSHKLVLPNYEWYKSEVVFLLIITDDISHCNVLIRNGDTFYRFEPYGSNSGLCNFYNDKKLDNELKKEILRRNLKFKERYFSSLSFQSFQNTNPNNNNYYCIWWCFFFICNIFFKSKLPDIKMVELLYIKRNRNSLTENINGFINENIKLFNKVDTL